MSQPDQAAALRIRIQIVEGEDVKMAVSSERTFPAMEAALRRAVDLLRLANTGQTVGKRSA